MDSLTSPLAVAPNLPQLTPWFAFSLVLLAVYWWSRVAREARAYRVPRIAWWAVPGLTLMLFSQNVSQPQPVFFALGAAALLLAEFWPYAYRRALERPPVTWAAAGMVLGLALLAASGQDRAQSLAFATGFCAVLAGLGGLISAAFWPRPRPASLGFSIRWKPHVVPEWPDLSVTLTTRGAQLTNVSRQTLELAGWSPVSINGWLMVRDEQGQTLNRLRAGQSAFLPLPSHERGVRVWYAPEGQTNDARLFRADWVPVQAQTERVLN